MIDIVESLRRLAEPKFSSYPIAGLLSEAADEIENLRSMLDKATLIIAYQDNFIEERTR